MMESPVEVCATCTHWRKVKSIPIGTCGLPVSSQAPMQYEDGEAFSDLGMPILIWTSDRTTCSGWVQRVEFPEN